jgi:subtilase family serine protease
VKTSVRVATTLFQVPFHVYHHIKSQRTRIRISGTATVPKEFGKHIEFIAGLSELFVGSTEAQIPTPQKKTREPSPTIVPSLLKTYYNVPPSLKGTNPKNIQGIAAFNDEFSLGALLAFQSDQSLPSANVTRIGPDCLPNCDQYESDLDVQYITAMAPGVNTLFIAQGNQYWILQTVNDLFNKLPQKPYVVSFSYGWSELAQCEIAVANCPKLGYNSQQYVTATNTVFQKLGVLGITSLVSDGDDGAPSLGGASGNCPIDLDYYCPVGGCTHTTSSCSSFTITNIASGALCFFPMGLGSDACAPMLQDQNLNNALNAFFNANPNCALNLEADYQQNQHFYSACPCNQLQPGTASGYQISQYTFDQKNGPVFSADYPTSSPYVTSVGATQFVGQGSQVTSEVGCSILRGAAITTGGGFSSFQPQPDYQAAAVKAYLANTKTKIPPSFTFNASNRGYPDIAFVGHSYKIFTSQSSTDSCPCYAGLVDGTSASSPSFAGLVSLINDQLLNHNLTVIGFFNKLLYKMYESAPNVFNDISIGENRCNRAYCCQYGYNNAPGTWDPVTGLGTPNFGNMLKYILGAKQAKKLNV